MMMMIMIMLRTNNLVSLVVLLSLFWQFLLGNSMRNPFPKKWMDELTMELFQEYTPLLLSSATATDASSVAADAVVDIDNDDVEKDRITIYQCGHFIERDMEALFPKERTELLTRHNLRLLKRNDIVVTSMYGNCPRKELVLSGSIKVLLLNGEPGDIWYKFDNATKFYKVGPYPRHVVTNNTMKVYTIAHQLLDEINVLWTLRNLYDVDFKPTNSGEHFLLYVNSHCVPYREEAVAALSKIGMIHIGGKCDASDYINATTTTSNRQNLQRIEMPPWPGRAYSELRNRIKNYRFYFAMENTKTTGYISEKILNAFLGGSIPIYYGTNEIFHLFNKNAFIYYDIDNPQVALNQILELENNRTAYYEMLKQPILANGNETIREYFSLRDDIGGGQLKTRIRHMIGLEK